MRVRDRWLSLVEIAELMIKHRPTLANMSRQARRVYVRRIVQRAERRDGERYTKRVGRSLYVSREALESLLPYDAETVSELGREVAALAQIQRHHTRQLNGHGSRLHEQGNRIGKLEEKMKRTTEYLKDMAALD